MCNAIIIAPTDIRKHNNLVDLHPVRCVSTSKQGQDWIIGPYNTERLIITSFYIKKPCYY